LNQKPNAQYNVALPDSLAIKVITRMRKRMYRHFLETMSIKSNHRLLDVGVTSDQSYESSNYLAAWYPHKDKVTVMGIDNAKFLEELFPGVKFIMANGLSLPFSDNEFDFVHSSAVLEHIGGEKNVKRFMKELYRVARFGVCITTPNRWFPVEFHTGLPLVHWLPKPFFRYLMRQSGREFFSREENLNLHTKADLYRFCQSFLPMKVKICGIKLGGWTSNWMLFVLKNP